MPCCQAVKAEEKITYYVSPDGNDEADGSINSPLKTLEGARIKVQETIMNGSVPVDVIFRGGEYRFNKTVSFTELDSGTKEAPITYKAMENENVVFKASRTFKGNTISQVKDEGALKRIREEVRNKIVVFDLTKEGFTQNEIRENIGMGATQHKFNGGEPNKLYVDGTEQTISQWPNGDGVYTHWELAEDGRTIHFTDNEPTRWTEAKDWWIGGYNDYDFRYARVAGGKVDPQNRTLSVTATGSSFQFTSYQSRRWKAFNLLEEIDLPGEFYIDRNNMLLYLYPPYSLKEAEFELSVMGSAFINVNKTQNITFENLTFKQSRDDGVKMTDVRNIDFIGCTFEDISGMGIYVTGSKAAITDGSYWQIQQIDGSYDCDIRNCTFRNIGSSAIDISGGNVDTLEKSNNVIDNNLFYMCSQIAKNYNAVSLKGVGNIFTHNNISRCAFQGVYYMGNDHTIMYNEIHDVIQETDDCGAIYCGRNSIHQGTVIAYNYLHDLLSTDVLPFGHQTGLYWDDAHCGQTAYNNIIKTVRKNIYTNGTNNVFRDNTSINLVAASMDIKNGGASVNNAAGGKGFGSVIADPQLYFSRYKNLKEMFGIMVNGNVPELSKFNVMTGNLDVNAPAHIIGTYTMEHGTVKNNVNMEECNDFVAPEKQDYRIKSGSETAKLLPGLLDDTFDIEQIGLQDEKIEYNTQTSPFKLLYPVNGMSAVPASEIQFKWENSFGASKYRLVIATDRELKNVVYDEIADYNVKAVSGLDKNKVYYWKVYAVNRSRELSSEWESSGPVYTFSTALYEKLNTEYFDKTVKEVEEKAKTVQESEKPGDYPVGTKNNLESLINKTYIVANSKLGMFSQKTFDALTERIAIFFQKKGMVNKGALDFGDYIGNQQDWGGDMTFENGEVKIEGIKERNKSTSMAGLKNLERMTGSVIYSFDAKIIVDSKFVVLGLNKFIDAPQFQPSNTGYALVIKPDCIELQYSTGTAHDILTTVNYAFDDQYHKIEYGMIDIGIGNIVILNIDDKQIIEYQDVVIAGVNALCNFSMLVYNDTTNSITIRKAENLMDMTQFNAQVNKNLYNSAKVLIDSIDSGYNVREKFVILKKDAKKILTEEKVVDVSSSPTVVENEKYMVPVDKIGDILNAEVLKSGNMYNVKYENKETSFGVDACKDINGVKMIAIETVLDGLGRGYVNDPTTNLLIVGNIVTMNNIKTLTNLSELIIQLEALNDNADFIYQ